MVRWVQKPNWPITCETCERERREQQRHRRGDRLPGREARLLREHVRGAEEELGDHQPADEAEDEVGLPRRRHPVRLHLRAHEPEVDDADDREQRDHVLHQEVHVEGARHARVREPEVVGRGREHVERALREPHHEEHQRAQLEHEERGEDRDVHQAGAALLLVDHALLAEAEGDQRLQSLERVIEAVHRLHPPEHREAPVHDVDEDRDADEEQQGGDDRIHGRFTVRRHSDRPVDRAVRHIPHGSRQIFLGNISFRRRGAADAALRFTPRSRAEGRPGRLFLRARNSRGDPSRVGDAGARKFDRPLPGSRRARGYNRAHWRPS